MSNIQSIQNIPNSQLGTKCTFMSKQLSSEPPTMSNIPSIQNTPKSQLWTNRTLMSKQILSEPPPNSSYCKLILDTVSCEHIHSDVTGFSKKSLQNSPKDPLLHVQHHLPLHDDVHVNGIKGHWSLQGPMKKYFLNVVTFFTFNKHSIPYQLNFENFIIHDYIYLIIYISIIIIITIILFYFEVLVFCMPPDSGEKIALGVTVNIFKVHAEYRVFFC